MWLGQGLRETRWLFFASPQVRSLARTDEARGLLWLLEEEALAPGATEDALLERLFSYYGPREGDKKGRWYPWRALMLPLQRTHLYGSRQYCLEGLTESLGFFGACALMIRTVLLPRSGQSPLLRSSKPHHFLLGHSHGTNWVEYNVAGWLSYTKQNPATQNAPRLLQDSQK